MNKSLFGRLPASRITSDSGSHIQRGKRRDWTVEWE